MSSSFYGNDPSPSSSQASASISTWTSGSSTQNGRARISIPSQYPAMSTVNLSLGDWLSSLRTTKYSLLPSNSPDYTAASALGSSFSCSRPTTKRLLQITGATLVIIILTGYILRLSPNDARYDVDPFRQADEWHRYPYPSTYTYTSSTAPEAQESAAAVANNGTGTRNMWGWSEGMGWEADESEGLGDLGQLAEGRYRLHTTKGAKGVKQYFRQLYEFTLDLAPSLQAPILTSLHLHLPPSQAYILPPLESPAILGPPGMTSYKTIFQTDKTFDSENESTRKWEELNRPDGWTLRFFDDFAAQEWVDETFRRTQVQWAWGFMHRGVLRADFLRYLLPLIHGGVYSDVDTTPIRPIEHWGQIDVEYLDISSTDGEDWRSKLSTQPSVIVAVDVDVHTRENWQDSWPRPLGICQWTLSGAPYHPILLDAARRVVNASHVVEQWEDWRAAEIETVETGMEEGWEDKVAELRGQGREHAMNVMEWTGPGLFTDSVMAYLLARYDVTWHRLRGLHHPLRIGDVMVLPITAFSPGGEPDFRAEQPDSPQADVLHNFRGSWKGDGAR